MLLGIITLWEKVDLIVSLFPLPINAAQAVWIELRFSCIALDTDFIVKAGKPSESIKVNFWHWIPSWELIQLVFKLIHLVFQVIKFDCSVLLFHCSIDILLLLLCWCQGSHIPYWSFSLLLCLCCLSESYQGHHILQFKRRIFF